MAKTKQSGAKRKPQSRTSNAGRAPAWVLVLSGLLPGLFIAYLVHMHHERDGGLAEVAGGGGSSGASGDASESESGRPRFEFYELLSEMEVVVPEESEPENAPVASDEDVSVPTPETDKPAPAESQGEPDTEPDTRYMIQAGSFRSHADADRLKAQLALMGVQAKIQSVEVEGGETWHRVRLGPFDDRNRVEALRGQLEDENLDSILLRLRG